MASIPLDDFALSEKVFKLRQLRSAAEYAKTFQRYTAQLNWNDAALMSFYYRGLKEEVKDIICMKARPSNFHEYIAESIEIDNLLYERRLEKRRERRLRQGNHKAIS